MSESANSYHCDHFNIIELDVDKTPEDLVYEWNSKVQRKIKTFFIAESEQSLDTLMKWYIKSIKEEVVNFEAYQTLKVFIPKHIQFFKLYFTELNCCFVDNYLDNMEEILTCYLNLEVKSLPVKRTNENNNKKYNLSVCQKIISTLSLYLLNNEDRVYHVAMKIKLSSLSAEGKELLNLLYGKLLTRGSTDKSDLGFCRAYILYQKWKTLKNPDDWENMDSVMYSKYGQTPESVKTNKTFSQILLLQNNSVTDVLIHINEKHVIISEAYFKFIKSSKSQEESPILPEIKSLEIHNQIIPDLENSIEDGEFDGAYHNFVKVMSSLSRTSDDKISGDCVTVKVEEEEDDEECQFVAMSTLGYDSENTELVYEILDDDDDIQMIYFRKKEQHDMAQKNKREKCKLSFLDTIEIPDSSNDPTEKVSSSFNAPCLLPHTSGNLVTTSTKAFSDSPRCNHSAQESVISLRSLSPRPLPDATNILIDKPDLQESSECNSTTENCSIHSDVSIDGHNEKEGPMALNELKVTVGKLDAGNCENVAKPSEDVFSQLREVINLRRNKLKERHNVHGIISQSPVSKVKEMSNSVSPGTNFGPFNTAETASSCGKTSPQTSVNLSGNNSGEVISPTYEQMGDVFRNYKKNKNCGMSFPVKDMLTSNPHNSNSVISSGESTRYHHGQNLKEINSHVCAGHKNKMFKTSNGKRMHITFAEPLTETSSTISQSPTEMKTGVAQSILKKSTPECARNRQNTKRRRLQIPRHLMNLQSFAHFNVQPNDPCIQGHPYVFLRKLSNNEISQWLKVSELSRKVRLLKQQTSKQLTWRVDYDKQPKHVNEKNVLRCNSSKGVTATISTSDALGLRPWRSNIILQSKSNNPIEGMVSLTSRTNINENYSRPIQCENMCCRGFTTALIHLIILKFSLETVLNLSCSNPDPALKCCLSSKPNPFVLESKALKNIGHLPRGSSPSLSRTIIIQITLI